MSNKRVRREVILEATLPGVPIRKDDLRWNLAIDGVFGGHKAITRDLKVLGFVKDSYGCWVRK